MTRVIGILLPARLYHWLVVRAARLPLVPARSLRHSVVFRHPLHPRTKHYVLVPTEYSSGVLHLPRDTAGGLQEDILRWVETSGWRYALIVVNFGAWQETPFLHIHLLQSATPPAGTAPPTPGWLSVELEDGEVESGRRVVRYDAVQNTAEVTFEVNRT